MKKPTRQSDGYYHVDGDKYKILIGSRAQVHNRTAYKTPGGLKKHDLLMNKWGRIVSKKKHLTEKKKKTLFKLGFRTRKGKFGFTKKETKNKTRRSK
jgi:hypothetical protein